MTQNNIQLETFGNGSKGVLKNEHNEIIADLYKTKPDGEWRVFKCQTEIQDEVLKFLEDLEQTKNLEKTEDIVA